MTALVCSSAYVELMLSISPIYLISRDRGRLKICACVRPDQSTDGLDPGQPMDFHLQGSGQFELVEIITKPVRWRQGQVFFEARLIESP